MKRGDWVRHSDGDLVLINWIEGGHAVVSSRTKAYRKYPLADLTEDTRQRGAALRAIEEWEREHRRAAPERPCVECGKPTRNTARLCGVCGAGFEDEARRETM